jgi:hypothetical protein
MGCCQHEQKIIISSQKLTPSQIKQLSSLEPENSKSFIKITLPLGTESNQIKASTPIENQKTKCPNSPCQSSFRSKSSNKLPILNKLMFKNRSIVSTITSTNN